MVKPRQWQPMFDGNLGLKQGYAITNMPPGSCLDIKNMYLNGLGGKTSRGGYTEIFHTTNGVSGARLTSRVRSLLQYKPFGGTVQELCYAGTRILKRSGTTTAVIASGLTDDQPWEWLQYRDLVLGVNGVLADKSFLYNGTTYTTIGITAPTSHLTTAIQAGGALPAGTYSYLATFYDSSTARESNPFTVTTAPTVISAGAPGNATAHLLNFPSVTAGEGVTHIRIYRMKSTETAFYRIAELAIATTTYDDAGDAATTLYLEYDTGAQDKGYNPPKRSSLIAMQFDRIFMVDEDDPSILIYSKVGEYWAFPTANYYYVGRGDGSRIKRIERHGESLLIHKGNGWYILSEDPSSSTASIKLLSNIGSQDFRTSVSAHNQVVRLTPTGFYKSVPTDYSTADLREDYIGNDVCTFESAIDWGNSNLMSMYNHNASNRRHVYWIEPVSASYYSKCLVYDIVLSQWVYYELGTDVYSVADYVSGNQQYMMMGDGYGIVWQWDIGNADGHSMLDTASYGTATSGGATTLVDTTKAWTVNGLVGCVVKTWEGTGLGQSRRITSNTANTLTVATWTTNPALGTTYTIGGIEKYAEEYWDSNGDPHLWKRSRWVVPYVKQTGNYNVTLSLRRDYSQAYEQSQNMALLSSSSLWGVFLWGVGTFGGKTSNLKRLRLHGKYHYYSIRYYNRNAAQRLDWDGHGMVFQVLGDRNK